MIKLPRYGLRFCEGDGLDGIKGKVDLVLLASNPGIYLLPEASWQHFKKNNISLADEGRKLMET